MEYVRLYTAVLTHPKWMVLSDSAKALLVQAWIYAGLQETDGFVPDSAAKVVGVKPKAAVELESAGWWARNGTGWDLNDWQDHQVNADELRDRRERLRGKWAEDKRRRRAEGKES